MYDGLSIWDIIGMVARQIQEAPPLWARAMVVVGLIAILAPFVWAAWAMS